MQRTVIFALLLLSLIWGGSYFFIKVLLTSFHPWTIAFLRSALGLILISAIMIVCKKPFGFKTIPWIPMAVMALINTAIPWAIIGFSETRISSSLASILNATTPLWTLLIGIAFFRKKTTVFQWLGMLLSIFGLIVLVGFQPDSMTHVDGIGFWGMILASLCYAIGAQLSKRLSANLSMYQVTFCTLLICMAGSGVMAFSLEPIPFSSLLSLPSFIAVLGLGLLGSGMAYILFFYIVQKGSPEMATMVTYLIPGSGILWGSILLQERIGWNMLIGLGLVLSGIFLAGRKGKKGVESKLKQLMEKAQ